MKLSVSLPGRQWTNAIPVGTWARSLVVSNHSA